MCPSGDRADGAERDPSIFETLRGVGKAKRHDMEFVVSAVCRKSGFSTVCRGQLLPANSQTQGPVY